MNNVDLCQFHFMNAEGKAVWVFQFRIYEYIKKTQPMFVLGGTPFLYSGGVFEPDISGARLKTMIRNLIYPQFIKAATVNSVYQLFLQDVEL